MVEELLLLLWIIRSMKIVGEYKYKHNNSDFWVPKQMVSHFHCRASKTVEAIAVAALNKGIVYFDILLQEFLYS